MPNLLKVRVSLKGRPVRTYTFNKKTVMIGRDPTSDIFLDNTGISRSHARIERTPGGYQIEDLGSANGTFINDRQIRKDYLGHDDVVRIGKFALWMGVESDRRELAEEKAPSPGTYEGTAVLSPEQLLWMQQKAKEKERQPGEPADLRRANPAANRRALAGSALVTAVSGAFLLGVAVGASLLLWYLG